jgi:hypothetical protein
MPTSMITWVIMCVNCWILILCQCFYYYLVCEAIGTAATPGLLCQPRVMMKMIVEKHMECRLAGETEVLGGYLPQRHFCPSQNPTWPDPGLNLGRRGGKPATNRLRYGAAIMSVSKLHFYPHVYYVCSEPLKVLVFSSVKCNFYFLGCITGVYILLIRWQLKYYSIFWHNFTLTDSE